MYVESQRGVFGKAFVGFLISAMNEPVEESRVGRVTKVPPVENTLVPSVIFIVPLQFVPWTEIAYSWFSS